MNRSTRMALDSFAPMNRDLFALIDCTFALFSIFVVGREMNTYSALCVCVSHCSVTVSLFSFYRRAFSKRKESPSPPPHPFFSEEEEGGLRRITVRSNHELSAV